MGITSGFFNSLNGDRKYNAEQMSSLFDGIINDGVFATLGTAMDVKAFDGYIVHVGIGRAWFDHTWINNDSILPIELEPAELLTNRYDVIVIEVDHTESVRKGFISVVKGTPSETAAIPELVKSELRNQYPLCYIYRGGGSTKITQADITNMIGTDQCPYVTGLLQVVSIDGIIAQWKAQWDLWFSEHTDASANDILDFENRMKGEITTWFNNIKVLIDGNTATNLANKILELTNRIDRLILDGGGTFPLEDNLGNALTDSNGSPLEVFFKMGVDCDAALSDVSENPVQNKVVTKALNGMESKVNTELRDAVSTVTSRVPFQLGIDANGNYGYYKAGADTVTPFRGPVKRVFQKNTSRNWRYEGVSITQTVSFTDCPYYKELTINDFAILSSSVSASGSGTESASGGGTVTLSGYNSATGILSIYASASISAPNVSRSFSATVCILSSRV